MPEESFESIGETTNLRGLRRMRQDTSVMDDSLCSPSLGEDRNQKRQRLENAQHGETSTSIPPSTELPRYAETAIAEAVARRRAGEDVATTLLGVLPNEYKRLLQELLAKHQLQIESHQQQLSAQAVAIESQQEVINLLKRDIENQPMVWLEDVSYPRSRQHQLSVDEIEPWMIELEENTTEISDLILEDWQKPSSPMQTPKMGQDNDLFKLMSIVAGSTDALRVGELRSDYVLRALIVASVSEWVFADKYPTIEADNHWKEFQILLLERAIQESPGDADRTSHKVAKAIEGFEKDILYRRATNPYFVNKALRARSYNLAKRLAVVVVEFLRKSKHRMRKGVQQNTPLEQVACSWLSRIEDLFLDALKFAIRLRLQKMDTTLEWPKKDVGFDRKTMRALDGGSASLLNSQHIALTIMPAAVLEVSGGSGRRLKREALVYMNIPEQTMSSNNQGSSAKTPEITTQRSTAEVRGERLSQVCRKCGEVNRSVKPLRKRDSICYMCIDKERRQEASRARDLEDRDCATEKPTADKPGLGETHEADNLPHPKEVQSHSATVLNTPIHQGHEECLNVARDKPAEYVPAPMLDDPERPWVCSFCGRGFAKMRSMSLHQSKCPMTFQRGTSKRNASSNEPRTIEKTDIGKGDRKEVRATETRKQQEERDQENEEEDDESQTEEGMQGGEGESEEVDMIR